MHGVTTPDDTAASYAAWDIREFWRCYVEAMALPIPDEPDESAPSAIALVLPNR